MVGFIIDEPEDAVLCSAETKLELYAEIRLILCDEYRHGRELVRGGRGDILEIHQDLGKHTVASHLLYSGEGFFDPLGIFAL